MKCLQIQYLVFLREITLGGNLQRERGDRRDLPGILPTIALLRTSVCLKGRRTGTVPAAPGPYERAKPQPREVRRGVSLSLRNSRP